MTAIIINLPYTAASVPPPLVKRLDLTPEDWQLEHSRLIDPCLAQVVREATIYEASQEQVSRPVAIYPYSPVVADPWGLWVSELNGEKRPLAASIFAQTTAGRAISWNPKERELIFSRTVEPFFQKIDEAVQSVLEKSPMALVLTVRSYGSKPFIFEKNKKHPRPQAAVSMVPGRAPDGLAYLAGDVFRAFRWWPELNWPHDGGACLTPSWAGNLRVKALGLSLRRDLYMNEQNGRLKGSAESVIRVLRSVFNLLDQELARVAQVRISRRAVKSPVIKAQ